jgi:hypothetical protein
VWRRGGASIRFSRWSPDVSWERAARAAGGRAGVLLPGLPAIELLANTMRLRYGMIEELG